MIASGCNSTSTNKSFTVSEVPTELEFVGRKFDYKFLQEISVSHEENRIYELCDLNGKLTRGCTAIKIPFNTDFGTVLEGNKIRDDLLKYLKYYKILFQGIPLENEDSLLSKLNVTWLVELSSGYMTAVYEVNSEYYTLDLVQCRQIWGTPPLLRLNKSNTMTRTRHDGQEVTTPIVPKGYLDFLLERDVRLKEIRQMFEVGGHPGFVTCHEVLEHTGRFRYYILVVVDSFKKRLRDLGLDDLDIEWNRSRRRTVNTEKAPMKKTLYHLLASLAYWHDKGIAHRDIRPENIRYTEKMDYDNRDKVYYPQISSFGLSKQFDREDFGVDYANPQEYRQGTSEYRAPELSCEAGPVRSEKADVYSLGVTFFEVMNGYKPFFSNFHKHLGYSDSPFTKYTDDEYHEWSLANVDPSLPSSDLSIHYGSIFAECTNMSLDAKNLIAKMLFPDPARRPTAREAMQHPWFDGISSSYEQEVCAGTGAVKKVDIVNVEYHPIVWQEDKERVEVGGSRWDGSGCQEDLQHTLPDSHLNIEFTNSSSSSGNSSNNSSCSNSPNADKYWGWEEGRGTDTDANAAPLTCRCEISPALIPTFLSSLYTIPCDCNEPCIELVSLFRTVEQHEKYLQAAAASTSIFSV